MKDQNTLTDEDFSKVPANRLFQFTLISSTKKRAEISMPLAETYLQEGGVVHGGVISSLADTAAVYTLYPYLTENQSMTSIEFKMNFLSPALFENGDLLAQANLVKRGRKVALCDVEVYQKEKLVAKGLFSYLLF